MSDDPADLVNVRYMVDDVEASIDFYTCLLYTSDAADE